MSCSVNRGSPGYYALDEIRQSLADVPATPGESDDPIGKDVSSTEHENIVLFAEAAVAENPDCYEAIRYGWQFEVARSRIDVVTEGRDVWNFETDQFIEAELKELRDEALRER